MNMAVKYLNQFLPSEHYIQYISFDMARKNKGKEANVMGRLANIANYAVLKTGIFQSLYPCCSDGKDTFNPSNPLLASDDLNYCNLINDQGRQYFAKMVTLQTGIIRTNCVDCLDRTNTAQFAIGKCALGYQLYILGILNSPKLEFDTDCVRMLEELYEDHGDTLALQYGGSQLVHRIKTYRKTAPWTSQGNDIMQTLSRYYSNTFSDQEKQHTINLFLGLFIPEEGKPPIWELTDYYLHHKPACKYSRNRKILSQWWDNNVLKCLPYALFEISKTCIEMVQVQNTKEEIIDIYYDYYRPYELSLLAEVYAYKVSHSVRDFMPHFTTNFSPFAVRVRPGRRREEAGNKSVNIKNPSLTGQSSASSTASSDSSSVTSSDDEQSQQMIDSQMTTSKNSTELCFEALFPSMREIYGVQPESPKRNDIFLYRRFVLIGRNFHYRINYSRVSYKLFEQTSYANINHEKFREPIAANNNISIYEHYVIKEKSGGSVSNPSDMSLYERYAHQQQLHLGILHPDLC